MLELESGSRRVYGEHDDGAIVSIIMLEKNGAVAFDVIGTPYTGCPPTKEAMDELARVSTNCKTAQTVQNIDVHLIFNELIHTCPNAKHVGGAKL